MRSATIYRLIEDCYSPDGEEIEVEIEVEFSISGADPSVGIMSEGVEDVCVVSTDSDQCTIEQAQAWIDGNSKDAERAIEKLCEIAAEDDAGDLDYRDECREEARREYFATPETAP